MSDVEDEFPELKKRPPEITWEFYCKTKFGNNIYLGFIHKTNKYQACSDGDPLFIVPPDKFDRVEQQIKFALEAYEVYLTTKIEAVPEV